MHPLAIPGLRRRELVLAAAWSSIAGVAGAQASAYPAKPVRVVVNSAAGGLADIVARLVGARISASLGQPLVVDNRPGAAGLAGAEAVARAEPDGYTVGVLASAITVAPALVPGTTFDARTDLTPIALLATAPMLLVTHPETPYETVEQVVADARRRPGRLTVASGGSGTMTHLVAEQFMVEAGVDLLHVPYKGGGPALNDVLANQVSLYFDTLGTSTTLVQAGRLRALAIVAPRRSPLLPDVPTIAQAGFPGVQGRAWFALVAPIHTPPAIVAQLNAEANKALATPDVRERLISLGGTVEGGPAEVLSELIQHEVPRWSRLVKDRHIKM